MKIRYTGHSFSKHNGVLIKQINSMFEAYAGQGYQITLRQLYYYLISKHKMGNTAAKYKALAKLVEDACLSGDIDWNWLQASRRMSRGFFYKKPLDILQTCTQKFRVDPWAPQSSRVEVWVNKDNLLDTVKKMCAEYSVPVMSCQNLSIAEMHNCAKRIVNNRENYQGTNIIYLSDHDPDGYSTHHKITKTMRLFCHTYATKFSFEKAAISPGTVNRYNLIPAPGVVQDAFYKKEYGELTWELEALPPSALHKIILSAIEKYLDRDLFKQAQDKTLTGQKYLSRLGAKAWK